MILLWWLWLLLSSSNVYPSFFFFFFFFYYYSVSPFALRGDFAAFSMSAVTRGDVFTDPPGVNASCSSLKSTFDVAEVTASLESIACNPNLSGVENVEAAIRSARRPLLPPPPPLLDLFLRRPRPENLLPLLLFHRAITRLLSSSLPKKSRNLSSSPTISHSFANARLF